MRMHIAGSGVRQGEWLPCVAFNKCQFGDNTHADKGFLQEVQTWSGKRKFGDVTLSDYYSYMVAEMEGKLEATRKPLESIEQRKARLGVLADYGYQKWTQLQDVEYEYKFDAENYGSEEHMNAVFDEFDNLNKMPYEMKYKIYRYVKNNTLDYSVDDQHKMFTSFNNGKRITTNKGFGLLKNVKNQPKPKPQTDPQPQIKPQRHILSKTDPQPQLKPIIVTDKFNFNTKHGVKIKEPVYNVINDIAKKMDVNISGVEIKKRFRSEPTVDLQKVQLTGDKEHVTEFKKIVTTMFERLGK